MKEKIKRVCEELGLTYYEESGTILLQDKNIFNKVFDLIDQESISDNYRIKYEDITKQSIPKNFDVHHININHDDNHISNLVVLPHELHLKYHKFRNKIHWPYNPGQFDAGICDTILFNHGGTDISTEIIDSLKYYKKFLRVKQVCCNWVYLRDSILGLNNFVFESFNYEYLYKNNKYFHLK